MGLYIPNAKIPVSCNKCYEIGLAHRLRDLGGHCPRMDLHYSPDEQSFKGDRRADCPLRDVPPHGQLIDADDLFEKVYKAWGTEYDAGESNWFMDMINDAPTIIPADEAQLHESSQRLPCCPSRPRQ